MRNQATKLPNDHGIFVRLTEVVTHTSVSKEWFGVAEQAVNAIYALAESPDELCSNIIRRMTRSVFSNPAPAPVVHDRQFREDQSQETESVRAKLEPMEPIISQSKPTTSLVTSRCLADLLFIVAHVAIKQIVYIEACEAEFKCKKADSEKDIKNSGASKLEDTKNELDLVNGTSEDEFSDAMVHIRERELLFGTKALLSKFGPLIVEICKNNTEYNDETLQTCATMALAKFMCVSSVFCESHLELFLIVMEKSTNPATRSNLVIAMGDMTVCFTHILDDCSEHLYRRLRDPDPTVKKTCLMTLTFLVLAGQVKVKGQLGEMAICLEDEDKRIADLARMFFTELSTKDNAIYNGFTDIFSMLSSGTQVLDEDTFRKIIKFLMTFIEKAYLPYFKLHLCLTCTG